jgi:transposase InsO family protein
MGSAVGVGEILKREGLVYARRRKPRPGSYYDGLSPQDAPNAVWAADFKGHFKLGDGRRCYPLTISDGFSRFLLRCQALQHPAYSARLGHPFRRDVSTQSGGLGHLVGA